MLPSIGITTSVEDDRQVLALDYVRAVEAAGGLPVIVPAAENPLVTRSVMDRLDGLIITGGPAVTDGMLGQLPDDISEPEPIRLATDQTLLRNFLRSSRPILGICYGMQLINAAFGGTIYADVQRQHRGSLVHSHKRGGADHPVELSQGSWLSKLLNTNDLVVNTRHIQAVADPGHSMDVTARAPDGVIEGIEGDDGRIIGVQFHPELMGALAWGLFEHVVNFARENVSA